MTTMDKPVRRKTVQRYRITLARAFPDAISGKQLVVELANNGSADLLRIREAGRRKWIEMDVAELYRIGLIKTAKRG